MGSSAFEMVRGHWHIIAMALASAAIGATYLWVLRRRNSAVRAISGHAAENPGAALYQGLVESSPVGLFLLRPDGEFSYLNPVFREMLGLAEHGSLEVPEFAALVAKLRRHAQDGVPFRFRETLHLPSRSLIGLEVSGRPLAGPAGSQSIVGAVQDITPQIEVEHGLRAVKEEAERANLVKSLVFANMSHEIRTPLTAIIGYSELLEQRLQGTQTHAFARTIRDGGRRLLNLLNGIIDLARIDSGKYPLVPKAHPLRRPIDQVVSLLGVLARQKGIDLKVEVEPGLSVFSDEDAEQQIWTNLINNAIRFTQQGGITVRAAQSAEQVVVTVEDTGDGIAAWFLPHVFEEFRQESTLDSASQEGSGLGLPITKRLIDRLGGSVCLQSEKGAGTIVEVRLPAAPPQQAAPSDEKFPQVMMPQNKRLLLVEDDAECGQLMCELLGDDNRVHWFQNPQAALAFAENNSVDIVLMDIHLRSSQYDGCAMLQALRKLPNYREVPVLAVTAYAVPGDRDRFLADGFSGYVAKPFVAREFAQTLLSTLEDTKPAPAH